MTTPDEIAAALGVVVVAVPAALVVLVGVPSLVGRRLSERATFAAARVTVGIGLVCCLAILGLRPFSNGGPVVVDLGHLASLRTADAAHEHYHFAVAFEFDGLSLPLAVLSYVLCLTIAAFATSYLHREPGYNRFFVLFALFQLGMVTASLADTIETLFVGWELVGLSSALLVAFFQERPAPPRNGLRVWIVYRISDAALLLAAVVLHDMIGPGDFDRVFGGVSWPDGVVALSPGQALAVGLLLVVAAAGKSALVPFSGWLPRAMEGPTPSSAVFYGSLSVHLGAFLLLRMSPLIAASPILGAVIVALGLTTALYASVVGTVQTDIKSALSFASLSQVGLVIAEIGAGHWVPWLWYVALAHLIGHACLRTLQFLRAPTLLQDYRVLENAIGDRLPRPPGLLRVAPAGASTWLYRFALERGYLDAILSDYVARPFVAVFTRCGRIERWWIDFLNGRPTPPGDADT